MSFTLQNILVFSREKALPCFLRVSSTLRVPSLGEIVVYPSWKDLKLDLTILSNVLLSVR